MQGWIDEFRLVKGKPLYGSAKLCLPMGAIADSAEVLLPSGAPAAASAMVTSVRRLDFLTRGAAAVGAGCSRIGKRRRDYAPPSAWKCELGI